MRHPARISILFSAVVISSVIGPSLAVAGTPTSAPDEAKPAGTAVKSLVDQFRSHPAQGSGKDVPEKHRLYLLDVAEGHVTLIADEPGPGLTHCGSARWSQDGKRILFDATPKAEWNQSHIFALEYAPTGPKLTDLGLGNCPSPSPDGKSVAFLLNPGAVPSAASGIWVMNADGSGRRRLGSSGRPFWSPDGRQLLIVSFADPCQLKLMDVATMRVQPIAIPDFELYSVPSWVDEKTLVGAVGTAEERAIALIDLTDPKQGKIRSVLRAKDGKPSVIPTYPSYSTETGRCFFINANPKGKSLYMIEGDKMARPRRLERDGFDKFIADPAPSPDGRYLLFCCDRTARPGMTGH